MTVPAESTRARWTIGTARRVDARGVAHTVPWIRTWVDHGLRDQYGRRIGGHASIVDLTATEADPARRFELRVQVTRDQVPFGAARGVYRYDGLDRAQREALTKLAQQRVRQHRAHEGSATMTREAAHAEAQRRWGTAGSAEGDRYGFVTLRRRVALERCEVGFCVRGVPTVRRVVVARGETWAAALALARRYEIAAVARCLLVELRDGGAGGADPVVVRLEALSRELDNSTGGALLKTLLDRGILVWREGLGYRATAAGLLETGLAGEHPAGAR